MSVLSGYPVTTCRSSFLFFSGDLLASVNPNTQSSLTILINSDTDNRSVSIQIISSSQRFN